MEGAEGDRKKRERARKDQKRREKRQLVDRLIPEQGQSGYQIRYQEFRISCLIICEKIESKKKPRKKTKEPPGTMNLITHDGLLISYNHIKNLLTSSKGSLKEQGENVFQALSGAEGT